MAYTIISQNNSTTTLSDGVNTITVPSRVNLTSGNFTIVEVNNNMATLEDGDGNVYRDIPCVATLVDAGGGGSSLPDQTGHSGEFLTTDGTDASWSDKPLVNLATGAGAVAAGLSSEANSYNSVSYGAYARSRARNSMCLGGGYASAEWSIICGMSAEVIQSATGAIQLGYGTNSDASTFKVGLVTSTSPFASGNYELLSSDGTIPEARLADTTNAQQGDVLTLDANGDAVWQAGSGGGLPSQTGNAGKFLTTDGTDASWGTTTNALTVQKTNTNVDFLYFDSANISGVLKATGVTYFFSFDWVHNANYTPTPYFSMELRQKDNNQLVCGYSFGKADFHSMSSTTTLGKSSYKWANTYTEKLNNGADIAVPTTGGTMAIQVSSMPTASSTLEGQIYQFTGTTDATYTHGYIYECVSDGGNPATYSWTAVQVQAGGGGGLQNTATQPTSIYITDRNASTVAQVEYAVVLGQASGAGYPNAISEGSVVIGCGAYSLFANYSIAVGKGAVTRANYAIQIGNGTNSDANTFKVGNENGNYEMMDANGNLPADRLASTTGLADGNYRLRLTITNGTPTLSWVAE